MAQAVYAKTWALYIQRDGFEIDDFGEGLIQAAAKIRGCTGSTSISVSTEVVYYNRDLLNELGLQIPKTWDEIPSFLEGLRYQRRRQNQPLRHGISRLDYMVL